MTQPTAADTTEGGTAASLGGITPGQMQLVLDVSRMLSVTADLDLLLQRIAEAVTALIDCERASIFLHDAATDELWTKVALQSKEIRIPAGAGIVGAAFKANQALHVPKPYEDPRFNPGPDRRSGFVTRNLLAAPMVDIDRNPVGVVQAVNKCSGDFGENDPSMLQLLADQAGVAIQRYRLQQAAVESMALRREMELARKVQEAMIPTKRPDVPGLESAGWTRPASINGGDCFDLWRLPDGRLGIFLADASGHGIAPALVVLQSRALVRALSDTEPDPHQLLVRVNRRLASDMTAGRFVTVFLGFLSSDGMLQWSSGGHGPILIKPRSGDAEIESLTPPLPPLGILDDLEGEPGAEPVRLDPGGWLAVMSDGITESFDPGGAMFGLERLLGALATTPDAAPDRVLAALRAAVERWQGRAEPHDDQTAVVVRRNQE